jgi:hypothetical protein
MKFLLWLFTYCKTFEVATYTSRNLLLFIKFLLSISCLKNISPSSFTQISFDTIDMDLWHAGSRRNVHSVFSWSCSPCHRFHPHLGVWALITTCYILPLTNCTLLSDNLVALCLRKSISKQGLSVTMEERLTTYLQFAGAMLAFFQLSIFLAQVFQPFCLKCIGSVASKERWLWIIRWEVRGDKWVRSVLYDTAAYFLDELKKNTYDLIIAGLRVEDRTSDFSNTKQDI